MVSLFERLERGRSPAEEPIPQQVPQAAGMLLDWLQNRWKKPVIRSRDIQRGAPHSIRDRESAISAAEILERRGWLVPMHTHRQDAKWWRIAIGP
jgi:hypothetical protein